MFKISVSQNDFVILSDDKTKLIKLRLHRKRLYKLLHKTLKLHVTSDTANSLYTAFHSIQNAFNMRFGTINTRAAAPAVLKVFKSTNSIAYAQFYITYSPDYVQNQYNAYVCNNVNLLIDTVHKFNINNTYVLVDMHLYDMFEYNFTDKITYELHEFVLSDSNNIIPPFKYVVAKSEFNINLTYKIEDIFAVIDTLDAEATKFILSATRNKKILVLTQADFEKTSSEKLINLFAILYLRSLKSTKG